VLRSGGYLNVFGVSQRDALALFSLDNAPGLCNPGHKLPQIFLPKY